MKYKLEIVDMDGNLRNAGTVRARSLDHAMSVLIGWEWVSMVIATQVNSRAAR